MAACQPHLEAKEGLEPLESILLCTQWFTCAGIFLLSGPAPEVMFSLPPSLFTNLLYAAVYFLQLQLWLVHEPVTPTMAAWQPHLGAREGMEPLGSDLEGC